MEHFECQDFLQVEGKPHTHQNPTNSAEPIYLQPISLSNEAVGRLVSETSSAFIDWNSPGTALHEHLQHQSLVAGCLGNLL